MGNGFSQRQEMRQKMQQTANASQVMLSNIIEMPLADFEQHVQNELESNEALEISAQDNEAGNDKADLPSPYPDYSENDEYSVPRSNTTDEDYSNFITIDQVPEDMRQRYNKDISAGFAPSHSNNSSGEDMINDNSGTSYDSLLAQIGELDLTETEQKAMEYLVGSLDENGYLSKDDDTLLDELAFQEYIDIDHDTLHRLVAALQTFEPRGIGAHGLQECMLLQLNDTEGDANRNNLTRRLARKVVRDLFDHLAHARWQKIQDILDVENATIGEIQSLIRRLNPRPGYGLYESASYSAPSIIPDFYVSVDKAGEVSVRMENGSLPPLKVSTSHQEIVEEHDSALLRAKREGKTLQFNRRQQEAYDYAIHKVEAAKAFIDCVRRRQATLLGVMTCIAQRQRDFFVSEDDETLLKPLRLQDIADEVQVDTSTVSRAVNAKFVRTDYGTYPLKFFFVSEFVSASGETVVQRKAMMAVKSIIEGEDPVAPFSDSRIAEILKEQEGLDVARRTVAKYRERLKIPVAQLRRKISK